MIEKRCTANRDHKPHWWSRTTRKTVTEETAGDTFGCPGRGRVVEVDPRGDEIRSDARSGRNWASEVGYGPACVCGAFLEGSAVTSWGQRIEKGRCYRHG